MTARSIAEKQKNILDINAKRTEAQKSLSENESKYEKINNFLKEFQIDSYREKKKKIEEKSKKLEEMILTMEAESESMSRNKRKQDLLSQVPCGSQFPSCKFIKDAHAAGPLVQISEAKISDLAQDSNRIGKEIHSMEPFKVTEYIDKYNQLVEKRNSLANTITNSKLTIERADNLLFKEA